MMRLIRQILGTSRREAEADACLQAHQRDHDRKAQAVRANVRAIEQLVTHIQKDISRWH
ncbi:hypothetical protein ACFOD7_14210 [Paracoccus fontiphilus]|uniref:Uncharacterized protein n=1 Tax=Paracoccus fontiphilus TaxID=1815556 RepID=A0ABV7IL94_9RHOB